MAGPARSDAPFSLGRRAFLAGAGAGAGLLLARGLGVDGLAGRETRRLAYEDALRRLAASLTPRQRELVVLPADHPSREITNTIAFLERPHLGTLLSPAQQALVERLVETMLSPRGREAFAGTFAVEGRLSGCVLAIYGAPESGRAQAAVMGGHLHLRGGGTSPEGAALGGAVAYGHQVGNQRWRVEGNAFAFHGDAANRFFAALAPDERRRAVLPEPPHELVVQPRGRGATLPGVAVASLGERGREEAARLVETVLSIYPEAEREEAQTCLDAQGGLGALHVASYASRGFYPDMRAWGELDAAERARRGDPYWQVWRVEGPGAVLHFQGHPHVHAYVHVVRDPVRARVGEVLGEVGSPVEGESMRALLEAAIRNSSGEALAWHDAQVPGRFCPGPVTSGSAFALDPYGNAVVVATLPGRAMAAPLRERLAGTGTQVSPDRSYRVGTTDWFARQRDRFGEPDAVESTGVLLREALVAWLRAGHLEA